MQCAISARLPNRHAHVTCTTADAYGAVHNDKGLDIPALRKHLTEGGKLQDFPGGEQCLPIEGGCCDVQPCLGGACQGSCVTTRTVLGKKWRQLLL